MKKILYTYILYSKSHNRFYIGQTNGIEERLKRHNSGIERSTKPFAPWELIGCFEKESRSEAMILEKKLKNLNTEGINKLIVKFFNKKSGDNLPL